MSRIIEVDITGSSPLLCNRFNEKSQAGVRSGSKGAFAGDDPDPREDAYSRAYVNSDGDFYVPGQNLFAAVIDAGKFHKTGKNKLTTLKHSLVPAGMMILEEELPLLTPVDDGPIGDFEIDERRIVNPHTGGSRMRTRPKFLKWKLEFTLELMDEELIPEALARAVVDDAGKKIGLGDFRPARRGTFGRFIVTRWHEDTA